METEYGEFKDVLERTGVFGLDPQIASSLVQNGFIEENELRDHRSLLLIDSEILTKIIHALVHFQQRKTGDDKSFPSALAELGLPPSHLVVLFACGMLSNGDGQAEAGDKDKDEGEGEEEKRLVPLLSAMAYLHTLSIRGCASSTSIFFSLLFQRALSVIRSSANAREPNSGNDGLNGQPARKRRKVTSLSKSKSKSKSKSIPSTKSKEEELGDVEASLLQRAMQALHSCVQSSASLIASTQETVDQLITTSLDLGFAVWFHSDDCRNLIDVLCTISQLKVEAEVLVTEVLRTLMPRFPIHLSPHESIDHESTLHALQPWIKFLTHLPLVHESFGKEVGTFLQHLAFRPHKKADVRSLFTKICWEILKALDEEERRRFDRFLVRVSHHPNSESRCFSVDMFAYWLIHSFEENSITSPLHAPEDAIDRILERAQDQNGNVRQRSLTALSNLLGNGADESGQPVSWFKWIDVAPTPTSSRMATGVDDLDDSHTHQSIQNGNVDEEREFQMYSALETRTSSCILRIFEVAMSRLDDTKAVVRKAGLCLIPFCIRASFKTEEDVWGMLTSYKWRQRCKRMTSDSSILVRRELLECVTHVFELILGNGSLRTEDTEGMSWVMMVGSTWFACTIPLVADAEATVSDLATTKCAQILPRLLQNHKLWKIVMDAPRSCLPFFPKALAMSVRICSDDVLETCCRSLAETPGILSLSTDSFGVDMLWRSLHACLMFVPDAIDIDSIVTIWDVARSSRNHSAQQWLLQIIASHSDHIEAEKAKSLSDDLLSDVLDFSLQASVIPHAIDNIVKMCYAKAGSDAEPVLCVVGSRIASQCESLLRTHVGGEKMISIEHVVRALATVGHLRIVFPSNCHSFKELERFVQFIAFNLDDVDVDVDVDVIERKSVDLPRGHAIIALGKLCMRSEAYARSTIPMLLKEIDKIFVPNHNREENAVIANNILVVFADVSVNHPSLVDHRHIDILSRLLFFPHELVRRTAITTLTGLYADDTIKMKNGLLYRFLPLLVDTHREVRSLARHSLGIVLRSKIPKALVNGFVESVYVLSGHQRHARFNRFAWSEWFARQMDRHFSEFPQRLSIFRSVLTLLSQEDRFVVLSAIVEDILDPMSSFNPERKDDEAVLSFSLDILLLPEMRFDARKLFSGGNDFDAEEGGDAAVMAGAKSALFSNVMKKNLMESIVPVVVELKHRLEAVHSPLLGKLVRFLQHLVREHRSEMEELLVGNRELANELEYDFRMEEAKEKVVSVLSKVGGKESGFLSPGVAVFRSPFVVGSLRIQSPKTPQISSPSTIISPRLVSHRKRILRSQGAEDESIGVGAPTSSTFGVESPSLSILRMTSPNAIPNRTTSEEGATPKVKRSIGGRRANRSQKKDDDEDVESPVVLGSLAGIDVDQVNTEEENVGDDDDDDDDGQDEDPLWEVSV